MSEWSYHTLDEHIRLGNIELGRGDIISKIDIKKYPGPYPIYSSSAQGDGKFGEYGKFMFDEELISWSVDGGGNFFYRPKHQFSVTNVSGYLRIKTKELGYRFLYYSLALQHRDISFDYTTKAHPSVIKKLYSVPSIPKPEQDRIAEILSTLDETIAQTEVLIAKHQQIKAGLMHDLFIRGVTADGHLRPTREQAPDLYKESPLGWIPKEWGLSRCDSEFVIDSGITLGPHRRPNKSPHPYLRVANVYRDRVVLDDVAQLEATLEEVEVGKLKRYDLLVVEGHANRNEIGRCAMVFNDAEGMLFQNHLFRLRAVRLDPSYSLLWLNSPRTQHYWDSMCSTSSGLNTINRRLLGAMPILIPLQVEQRLIADAVFSCREEETTNAAYLAKLRQQKHGLMHDLLTGKVRVLQ